MSDDVKELLGRAFGEEPPLRIDRDEMIQRGRKRLRKRRFLEAGSVVAAVVVAVVGAATLTNLAGSAPERLPPAASYSLPTPQEGSNLPLPSPAEDTTSPSSGPEVPPQVMISGPEMSRQLTKALYDSGIVAVSEAGPLPGNSGAPEFRQYDTQYVYEADVVRQDSQGYLYIAADYAPDTVVSCDSVPDPFGGCELRKEGAGPVSYASYQGPDGENRVYVSVVLENGLRLAATASNHTLRERDTGTKPNAKVQPVLSGAELAELLTKAGLGVR